MRVSASVQLSSAKPLPAATRTRDCRPGRTLSLRALQVRLNEGAKSRQRVSPLRISLGVGSTTTHQPCLER